MSAVYGTKPVSYKEVEDNSGPQSFRHSKCGGFDCREALKAQKRVRGKNQRPDLLQICKSQSKRFYHRHHVNGPLHRRGGGNRAQFGKKTTRTLPESCLRLNIRKQGPGDQGEDRVDVRDGWLRQNALAYLDFLNTQSGNSSFTDRPNDCFRLVCIRETLRGRGQAFCHPKRESHVDRERKPHAGREQRT